MNAGLIRTLALWRGASVGFAGLLALELGIGALCWGMVAQSQSHPSLLSVRTSVALTMLGALITTVLALLLGSLLQQLPGQPLLRKANRIWLRQLLVGLMAWHWVIFGLPNLLVLWPTQPFMAICFTAGATSGLLLLSMEAFVLLPTRLALLPIILLIAATIGGDWIAAHVRAVPPHELLNVLGLIAMGVIALSVGLLPRFVARLENLTRPKPSLRPWYQNTGPFGLAPDHAGRVHARSLQPLVLATAPMGGRTLILSLVAWAMLVSLVSSMSQQNTLPPGLWYLMPWIVGITGSPWFVSDVWVSPRALWLPGALHRPALMRQLLRQALTRGLLRVSATSGLVTLGLSAHLTWSDALIVLLIAPAPALFSLAVALALGGRSLRMGNFVGLQVAASVAHAVACKWVGESVFNLPLQTSALWPWLALAWASSLPVLALAVGLNRKRWQRLDWHRMPETPAWASGLR